MTASFLGLLGLNGGGLVLILVIILFLSANFLFANELRDLIRGLDHGIDLFKKESSRICDEISLVIWGESIKRIDPIEFSLKLWIAQGFGFGKIPFAPGTFGSLVGLLWFALLLWSGSFWIYLLGMFAGVLLSAWLCGAAESILHRTDPPSVVLDEIIAIPVCFTGWVVCVLFQNNAMPSPEFFFIRNWLPTLGVIGVFRLFDVNKPWPVRQSQNLPGGWGVTVDDILAAVYVNAVVLPVLFFTGRA